MKLKRQSGQVFEWVGVYEELAVGDIHVFTLETSTFGEIQT